MDRNKNAFSVLEDDNGDEEHEIQIPEAAITPLVTYTFGEQIGRHVYQGTVSGKFPSPVSFIMARKTDEENFLLLKLMDRGDDCIVRVENLIQHEKGVFLVTEPLVPLDVFFIKEKESFGVGTPSDWWKRIEGLNHYGA